MTNAKTPHVHVEVIKAWADGAEIQYKYDSEWWNIPPNCAPTWSPNNQYRVKPETVVKYHGIMQCGKPYEDMNHTTGYHPAANNVPEVNDKGWKRIAIVKTTFVDRVPVAVELVK